MYDRSEYGKLISIYHRIDKHPNINFIADKVVQPTKVYVFYQPGQAITSEILPKSSFILFLISVWFKLQSIYLEMFICF